jgi:hypothetical protein
VNNRTPSARLFPAAFVLWPVLSDLALLRFLRTADLRFGGAFFFVLGMVLLLCESTERSSDAGRNKNKRRVQ